ncbi:PH domain-containing protein [Candidatus Poriferisodalis sp.]|uniref:PH domain-containing protein n=1 Tax=Candidatus Poriferisodalis sp. TaxID=3101277 RepID=UPI003B02DB33
MSEDTDMSRKQKRKAAYEEREAKRKARYDARMSNIEAKREELRARRSGPAPAAGDTAPTESEIRDRLTALGVGSKAMARKEIGYLAGVLEDEETIEGGVVGVMDANTWLVVCTDRRVIFLDKGLVYGLRQNEIPLDAISQVSHKTGMLLGSIEVLGAGLSGMLVKNIDKHEVVGFARALQAARRNFMH